MRIRSVLRLLTLALLTLGLAVPLADRAEARPFPDRIELPQGFRPEGITIGRGHQAYLGSLATGDIYRVNLRTGDRTLINRGNGVPAVGLKIDRRGRIFVAGGASGTARVIDSRTGETLRTYSFASGNTFINDVVITRSYAWFTDSQRTQLYGVPIRPNGALGSQASVVTLPLGGEWVQQPGFNANGIAQTPDRRALLVVQSSTGFLFRVAPQSGVATRVDLGGYLLTNGDGLLVRGRTLYVVQNRLNQVAVIRVNRAGTRGVLVDRLTSPSFDVPTTVAIFGRSLYLPNARFGTANPDTADYWITRINRH